MGYKIEEVEGIGPKYARDLKKGEITNTDHFLRKCHTRKGRVVMSKVTGISEKLLLKWANLADLMRINGIGPQYSELLEAAGVDTVKELRRRSAKNVAAKMKEVNEKKNLANATPSQGMVERWVEAAKNTEPTITH